MTRALLLIGLAAAVMLAGCGGGSSTTTQAGGNTTTKLITASAGGTVSAASGSGNVSVTIPAGALGADTTIQLTPLTIATLPAPLAAGNVMLAAATFGPAGTNFSSPVTITFPLPSAKPVGAQLVMLVLNAGGTGWTNLGLATVQGPGGLTATITVNHFSTLALAGTSSVSQGSGYIFASGAETTQAPLDFYFGITGTEVQPNYSPAKTSAADYSTITQATEGGYALSPIPIQVGTVLLFKGQMPSDTDYYKMKVLDIQGSTLTFVYEVIAAPPDILGEWNIGAAGTMSIMAAAAGPGYVIDVTDSQMNPTKMMDGTLSGNTLTGTWTHADETPGGTFTITFNAAFDQFTGSYSGTESGSWTGAKVP